MAGARSKISSNQIRRFIKAANELGWKSASFVQCLTRAPLNNSKNAYLGSRVLSFIAHYGNQFDWTFWAEILEASRFETRYLTGSMLGALKHDHAEIFRWIGKHWNLGDATYVIYMHNCIHLQRNSSFQALVDTVKNQGFWARNHQFISETAKYFGGSFFGEILEKIGVEYIPQKIDYSYLIDRYVSDYEHVTNEIGDNIWADPEELDIIWCTLIPLKDRPHFSADNVAKIYDDRGGAFHNYY